MQKKIFTPIDKDEKGGASIAIAEADEPFAPHRGELHLVGSGPGGIAFLTADARSALARSIVWVGYSLYLDNLESLLRPDQVRIDSQLTHERERCEKALDLAKQGARVALISSGDSGIYGMAGLALELWLDLKVSERPFFEVHPGLSALQLAAARLGAPLMHDFCAISLSDHLTPWPLIETRLEAAAKGDFVIAIYNPRSQERLWQLNRAIELMLEYRMPNTPAAVARKVGRENEKVEIFSLSDLPVDQVDMLTLILVGNSTTRRQNDRMITPRGY